jgi:opacity protein-like surface antigen
MRRSLIALWLIVLMSNAFAQECELPTLRGSSPYVPEPPIYARWSGYYVGGQTGYAPAIVSFGASPSNLIADILRFTELENKFHPSEWPSLLQKRTSGSGFGGFVGYNSQWDSVILGVEANYNRLSISATSSDSITRIVTLADAFNYRVTVTSGASVHLDEYGTARVRAGYVMNQFLPYFTAGLALAPVTYSKFATVSYPTPVYSLPPPVPPDQPPPTPSAFSASKSEARSNALMVGWVAGVGMDVMLMPNVFLRGEYEFVSLPVSRMQMSLHNVHLGGGFKF